MTAEPNDTASATPAPPTDRLSPESASYTPRSVELARPGVERSDGHFDGLHAEAKAALGHSANSLRTVTERYREAHNAEQERWQSLRRELDALEGGEHDGRLRGLRGEMELLTAEVELHRTELARLNLAQRSLENAWLFLERGDRSLVADPSATTTPEDIQMRIVEAQEAERTRLAQEVHDGPAQALTNAIFQVEYIERLLDQNPAMAPTELRFLRQLLRRELGDVRSFISQLRPPLLDQLGLDGAIRDTAETMTALTGLVIEMNLAGSGEPLSDGWGAVPIGQRPRVNPLLNYPQRPAGYSTTAPKPAKQLADRLQRLNCGDWTDDMAGELQRLGVGSIALHRGLYVHNPAVPSTGWFASRGLLAHGWKVQRTAGPVWLFERAGSGRVLPRTGSEGTGGGFHR